MKIDCNLNGIKKFVNSEKFANFLVNNTTDFGTVAFILQTLFEKIDEIEKGKE